MVTKTENKHLAMILHEKSSCQIHVESREGYWNRSVSFSSFVSRHVLDQIDKLYMSPHLDYGYVVYPKYDPEMKLDTTKRLEQAQYSAALAVTGAWRNTSR